MVALRPEQRRSLFAVLVIACVVVAVGYGGMAVKRSRANRGGGAASIVADPAAARALLGTGPTLMFRNDLAGDGWAEVGLVPLASPGGRRALLPIKCRRLYFAGGRGLCLADEPGFGQAYALQVFGADFQVQHTFALTGLPSRARVSPDGRYGATTVFVAGHSYASNDFSTETTLFDLVNGKKLANLEEYTVLRDGKPFKAVDFNFWGVTFTSDGNRFYATLKTGGKISLVEGDIAARQMRVLWPDVECPSLSPDGTRIAFKKRVVRLSGAVTWRFHVLDLRTMTETRLAEPRSVDDQIEWLDDQSLLYGVLSDVWTVPADGSGEPRRYLSRAISPAVINTAIDAQLPRQARMLTLPPADLGVEMTAAANVVSIRQDLPYTITVTNHGPAIANQVAVEIQLAPSVTVGSFDPLSAGSPSSCFVQGGFLSCTIDRLQPKESWTLQLIMKPNAAGLLRQRVTVSTAQPDAVPINNTSTVEVLVNATN